MAHFIQAIIGKRNVIEKITQASPRLRAIPLPQQYSLCLVDPDFVKSTTGEQPPQSTETFVLLSPGFVDYLRSLSRYGRIAYIETEYFGGDGGQGAAVFDHESVLMEPAWGDVGVINSALRLLDVKVDKTSNQIDEFSAIGLDSHRTNDEW